MENVYMVEKLAICFEKLKEADKPLAELRQAVTHFNTALLIEESLHLIP